MAEKQEPEYGLVMPFVSVVSKGGPHDDEAYTCGYEMGLLDAFLEAEEPTTYERTIHTSNRGQADLIAMRHGYTSRFDTTEYDEWTSVSLERPCSCGGTKWVEDKNWSPAYPELWKGERSPGDGMVPCGFCNEGGWDAPWPPGVSRG